MPTGQELIDDINPEKTPTAGEQLIADFNKQKTDHLAESTNLGRDIPPDQAAKVLDASAKTGLPPSAIPEDSSKLTRKPLDPKAIELASPATAELMRKSPHHASAIAADYERFKDFEQNAKWYDVVNETGKQAAESLNGLFALASEHILPLALNSIPGGMAIPKSFSEVVSKQFQENQEFLQSKEHKATVGQVKELIDGGDYAGALKAAAPMVMSQVITAPVGFNPVAYTMQSYAQAMETRKQDKAGGATELQADADAVINGAAALVGWKILGSKAVRGMVGDIVAKKGSKFGLEFAQNLIKNTLHSAGLFGAMSAGNTVVEAGAKKLTGIDENAMDDITMKAMESGALGALTGGVYGAAHGFGKWGEVREKVDASRDVAKAEQMSESYRAMVKASDDMKLQKLAPQVHEENLDAMLNPATKNIYMPVETFEEFAKKNGLGASELAKKLGVENHYQLASDNSAIDVKVPTASLLTRFGGEQSLQDLKDFVKFHPHDVPLEEAKAKQDAIKQKYKPVEPEKPKSTMDQVKDKFKEIGKSLGFKFEEEAPKPEEPKPNTPVEATQEAVKQGIEEPAESSVKDIQLNEKHKSLGLKQSDIDTANRLLQRLRTGGAETPNPDLKDLKAMSAAVVGKGDKIYTATDHNTARKIAENEGEQDWFTDAANKQGFVDPQGNFITRDEAEQRYGFRTSEALKEKIKDEEAKNKLKPELHHEVRVEKAKLDAERNVDGTFKKTTMLLPLGVNKLQNSLGMSESQATRYIKLVSEAGAKAKKEVVDKVIEQEERRQSKEWRQERRDIMKEFAADYDKNPAVVGRSILETRKMPDGSAVPEDFPIKDIETVKFPKGEDLGADTNPIMRLKPSEPLMRLSTWLGYKDYSHMLHDIAKIGPREETLNNYADEMMMSKYDNLVELNQEQIESAVLNASMEKALHLQSEYLASDHFAKFMGLAKTLVTRVRSDDGVKAEALNQLGQIPVEDISPKTHINGFLKNQKQSLKSLESGDIPEAIRQNEQARVNLAMHEMAIKAKKDIAWLEKNSKLLAKTKTRERLAMAGNEEVAVLDALRNTYALPGTGETEPMTKSLGEWSKTAMNAGAEPVFIPQAVIDTVDGGKSVNYKSTPWSEVSGVIDTIKQVKEMATSWNTVFKGERKIAINDLVDEFKKQHKEYFPDSYDEAGALKKDVAGSKTIAQLLAREVGKVRIGAIKPEAFAEKVDGDQYGGWFQRNIFERMSDATARKVDMDDSFQESLKAGMEESGYTRRARANAMVLGGYIGKKYFKTLDSSAGGGDFQPHNGFFTRDEQYGILHLMGHADGIDKLCKGYGWSKEGLLDFAKEAFSSDELKLAQKNWDYLKSLQAPYEKELSTMVGLKPKWIPAEPIELKTNDGKTVRLEGGYFPLKAEGDFSNQKYDAKKSLGDQLQSYFKNAMPKDTQLERRVEHNIPPSLEWAESLAGYVNAAHHDISARRAVVDMHKLAANDDVRNVLKSIAGPDAPRYVDELIYDFATQNRKYPATAAEKLVKAARNNVTTVATGFKASVGLAHFGSLFTAAAELGNQPKADQSAIGRFFAPFGGVSKIAKEYYKNFGSNTKEVFKGLTQDGYVKKLAEGHQQLLEDPEKFDTAFSKAIRDSDMMRQRLSGHTTDIDISNTERTIADMVSSGAGIKEFIGSNLRIPEIRRAASIMVRYADAVNSLVSYSVAYQDALAGELKNFPKGDHEAAVRYAESVVRKTKGSNNVEDMAPNQRVKNEWNKTFAMFLNPQMTQIEGVIKSARKNSNVGKLVSAQGLAGAAGTLTAMVAVRIMAPAMYEAMVHGHMPNKDEDEGLAHYAAKSSIDYLGSGMKWGRVGLNAIEQLIKTQEGGRPDLSRLNPVAGAGQTSFNALHALTKDDEMTDQDDKDVAMFFEYIAGSPSEMARKYIFPGAEK